MKPHLKIFTFLFLISSFSIQLFAGTTGKIAGILTDKETGEPLVGANIIVKETT